MKPDTPRPVPFHLNAGARSIFLIHYPPAAGTARGAVLYIPPFAEEFNKSRRMAALQARDLARVGWHVLQPDLTGCGDSSGGFSEATWEVWLGDILAARQWIRANCPGPLWFWGVRLGALLACASLESSPEPQASLLFWQPVISGSAHLQQFLRIRVAGERIAAGRESAGTKRLLDELRADELVEVSGYNLSPKLALPMADASLALPACVSRVCWFEIFSRPDSVLSPAGLRIVDSWKGRANVHAAVVQGPSFWQTQEIEEAPALLRTTTEALDK